MKTIGIPLNNVSLRLCCPTKPFYVYVCFEFTISLISFVESYCFFVVFFNCRKILFCDFTKCTTEMIIKVDIGDIKQINILHQVHFDENEGEKD